jgi:hypothetical protein
VERVGEAVKKVAAPAKYLDHARCDRAIRGKLAGDEPADARTRGKGEVDRSVPARHASSSVNSGASAGLLVSQGSRAGGLAACRFAPRRRS